jgi:class 3 adenylate cyclase
VRVLDRYVLYRDTPPDVRAALREHAAKVTRRMALVVFFLLFGLTFALWPFDRYVIDNPRLLAAIPRWRWSVIGISLLYFALNAALPVRARTAWALVATAATAAMSGVTLGGLFTIREPYFYNCYFFPFAVAALPLWLGYRVVATAVIGMAFPVAFVVMQAGGAADPAVRYALWMSSLMVLAGIVLGHAMFHVVRQNFLKDLQLRAARQRVEELLFHTLPPSIARRLQAGAGTIADRLESVSVLFADLVGFTALSRERSPEQIVSMLNDLFTRFDEVLQRHGVEKVKTIGDAYMAVAGAPEPHADDAAAIADCALDLLDVARELGVQLRIGVHSGPVVAGVIGRERLAYDVWGDTVNLASRLESHGEPGRIQVSEAVHARLAQRYRFEARGEVALKGRGSVPAWFLLGKDGPP